MNDVGVILEDKRALARPCARAVHFVFIFDDATDFDAGQAADENLRGIVFGRAADP